MAELGFRTGLTGHVSGVGVTTLLANTAVETGAERVEAFDQRWVFPALRRFAVAGAITTRRTPSMLTQLFVGAESSAIPMDIGPLHKGDVVSFSMSAAKRLLTKSHASVQFIVEQAKRRIGEKR